MMSKTLASTVGFEELVGETVFKNLEYDISMSHVVNLVGTQ